MSRLLTSIRGNHLHRLVFQPMQCPLKTSFRLKTSLVNDLIIESPWKKRMVGGWLLACGGMTFGTIVMGGYTRLTKAGLSMVDWHLFKEFPPNGEDSWAKEFEKYQQFPEYKLANKHITLDEFKRIWWTEYTHRMLGRSIGGLFLLPAIGFWAKGIITPAMKPRILIMGSLLLFQGLLGWWMVKSGLDHETASKYNDPRVSHYRLAAHLGSAFVLFSIFLSTSLAHLIPSVPMLPSPRMHLLRKLAMSSKGLVFLTALSGAFVAGLDGGLIYNTYPKMGDSYIPSDLMAMKPSYLNLLENPTTTQFDHRLLGHITLLSIVATWIASRRLVLPSRTRLAVNVLLVAGLSQVALGITTLLMGVPKELASSHQAGAVTLLSCALWLTHELKLLKYIPK